MMAQQLCGVLSGSYSSWMVNGCDSDAWVFNETEFCDYQKTTSQSQH